MVGLEEAKLKLEVSRIQFVELDHRVQVHLGSQQHLPHGLPHVQLWRRGRAGFESRGEVGDEGKGRMAMREGRQVNEGDGGADGARVGPSARDALCGWRQGGHLLLFSSSLNLSSERADRWAEGAEP